jgi:hypothetical protein
MLSSYMLELSPDVLVRYTKLKVIDNVDPLFLLEFTKAKLLSKIDDRFLPIDKSDITNSRSPYSDEEVGSKILPEPRKL